MNNYFFTVVYQLVKNPPAMPEIQVPSLSREDPLEKEMATHSSVLAWEIPWTEEPCGLQSMRSQESDTTGRLNRTTTTYSSVFKLEVAAVPEVPCFAWPTDGDVPGSVWQQLKEQRNKSLTCSMCLFL